MAIERTDYNHAAGVFDVDVAHNELDPIQQGGFNAWVRDGVGRYRLQCIEKIAYVESIVECFTQLNAGGSIGGMVTEPGIVLVNSYDASNNPADVLQFRIEIRQLATASGPDGVEPPLPTPVSPGAGSKYNVRNTLIAAAITYDDFLRCDSAITEDAYNVTLPTITLADVGKKCTVKLIGNNPAVTLVPAAGIDQNELIDGFADGYLLSGALNAANLVAIVAADASYGWDLQ